MTIKVWIGLALSAAALTAQVWGGSAAAKSNAPVSIELPSPISGATDGGSLEIDSSGRKHAAFEITLGGQVIYATCAANCSSVAGWTSVQVGDNGSLGSRPIIKLAPGGLPRMMYVREGNSGPMQLVYNACDSACTNAANWTELVIENVTPQGASIDSRLFALDGQGHPRAIISSQSGALQYFTCDSGCTAAAANWFFTTLNNAVGSQAAITIDSAGRPHVLYKTTDTNVSADNDVLAYATCAQTCDDALNWTIGYTFLVGRGFQAKYSIDTDSGNRPRIALYTAGLVVSDTAQANALLYGWCDAACDTAANWGGAFVGTAARDGVAPDLALDGNDLPHISYYNDDSGYEVGYATCSSACESSAGVWEGGHLESPLSYPSVPASGCITPFWYVTAPTALALDASGKPFIVFGARNLQTCGITVVEKLRLVRYIDVAAAIAPPATATPTAGPGTPSATPRPSVTPTPGPTVDPNTLPIKTYLPITRR